LTHLKNIIVKGSSLPLTLVTW